MKRLLPILLSLMMLLSPSVSLSAQESTMSDSEWMQLLTELDNEFLELENELSRLETALSREREQTEQEIERAVAEAIHPYQDEIVRLDESNDTLQLKNGVLTVGVISFGLLAAVEAVVLILK